MARTRTSDNSQLLPPSAKVRIQVFTANAARPNFSGVGVSANVKNPMDTTTPVPQYPYLGTTGFPLHGGRIGSVSTMTDERTRPGQFNPCNHVSDEWNCSLQTVVAKTQCTPQDGTTLVTSEFTMGAAEAINYNLQTTVTLPVTDDTLIREALGQMHPRKVKEAYNWAQNVGEILEGLGQMKSLLQNLNRLVDDMDRLNRWNSPAVRRILGQKTFEQLTLKNWADLAVAAHLGWQLAIAPVLASIKQYRKAMQNFGKELKKVASQEVTLHGRSSRTGLPSTTLTNNDYHKMGRVVVGKIEVCTSARVKYSSPLTKGLIDNFTAAYLGRRFNGSTAWELLPLSWVIDSFCNFGAFLAEACNTPLDDIQYVVIWQGWSKKTTMAVTGWVSPLDGTYGRGMKTHGITPSIITGNMFRTRYVRAALTGYSIEAGILTPPRIRLPSVGQLVTILELIYSIRVGLSEFLRVAQRVPLRG